MSRVALSAGRRRGPSSAASRSAASRSSRPTRSTAWPASPTPGGRRAPLRAQGPRAGQARRGDVLRARPRAGGAARARAAHADALRALLPGAVTLLLPNPAGRFPLACGRTAPTLGRAGAALVAGARRAGRRPLAGAAVERQRGRAARRAPARRRPGAHPRRTPTSCSTAASCRARRRRWSTCGPTSSTSGGRSCARAPCPHEIARAARVRAVSPAFVTGGSGFIGGALVRRLVADGWRVRALARSDASARAVRDHGAEAVRGDLDDVAAMAAGAAGCDVAFHCAAHLGDWGEREDFERGNVQGTRNVLDAARRAGVRRFVHVGTEAALLAGEPLVEVDERAPLRPDSPALYSSTKARAEQAVLAADRRRPRDGRRAPALRLGPRRHDAAAGDGRDGPRGALRVDRRRAPPDLDHPRRQRRRGPGARRRARRAAAAPTSSPTASRSSSATSSPACSRRRASTPPSRSLPAPVAPRWRRRGRPPGGCCRCPASRR